MAILSLLPMLWICENLECHCFFRLRVVKTIMPLIILCVMSLRTTYVGMIGGGGGVMFSEVSVHLCTGWRWVPAGQTHPERKNLNRPSAVQVLSGQGLSGGGEGRRRRGRVGTSCPGPVQGDWGVEWVPKPSDPIPDSFAFIFVT